MKTKHPDVFLFPHDTEPSGAPKVTLDVAKCLLDSNLKIEVVFPQIGELQTIAEQQNLPHRVIDNPPVAISELSTAKKISIICKRIHAVWKIWKLGKKNPKSIFWIGSTTLPEVCIAGFLSRKPMILHVHEDLSASFKNQLKISIFRILCDHFIFVSRSSIKPFKPIKKQKVSLIYNRIDSKIFESKHEAKELDKTIDEITILGVGFLTHRKGFDLLIKAVAGLIKQGYKLSLIIAGEDPSEDNSNKKELKNLVQEFGIEKWVQFPGYQSDMQKLYRQVDLYVLSSRNEAMPLSLIEAVTCGIPVIATNVGGVADIIFEEQTGVLIKSESVEALTEGIRKSIDSEQRTRWAENALIIVRKNFNPARTKKQYVQLAKKLLKK